MDLFNPRVGFSAFLTAAAVSVSRPPAIRSKPAGSSARSERPKIFRISSCEKCADSLSIKSFNPESLSFLFCRPLRFVAIVKSSVITIGRQHGMPRGRRVPRLSSRHPGKVTVPASLAGQHDRVSESWALPVRLDPRLRSMISPRPSDVPVGSFHRCCGLGRGLGSFFGFIPRARAMATWRPLSRQSFFASLHAASLAVARRFPKASTSQASIHIRSKNASVPTFATNRPTSSTSGPCASGQDHPPWPRYVIRRTA